jgi:hypothetical protein
MIETLADTSVNTYVDGHGVPLTRAEFLKTRASQNNL